MTRHTRHSGQTNCVQHCSWPRPRGSALCLGPYPDRTEPNQTHVVLCQAAHLVTSRCWLDEVAVRVSLARGWFLICSERLLSWRYTVVVRLGFDQFRGRCWVIFIILSKRWLQMTYFRVQSTCLLLLAYKTTIAHELFVWRFRSIIDVTILDRNAGNNLADAAFSGRKLGAKNWKLGKKLSNSWNRSDTLLVSTNHYQQTSWEISDQMTDSWTVWVMSLDGALIETISKLLVEPPDSNCHQRTLSTCYLHSVLPHLRKWGNNTQWHDYTKEASLNSPLLWMGDAR